MMISDKSSSLNCEECDESDKSDRLTIDTPPENRSSRKSPDKILERMRKRRKRKRIPSASSSGGEEELVDKSIEETIHRCAAKNNLTPDCVKKLLKKLVMNDHVLAIVKLKEEEQDRIEKMRNESNDADDEGDPMFPMTRLMAKQLNKKPLPIAPLKETNPDEEIAALIREELHSDDDDEEYQPKEEDYLSDDETNTTISDIDSQPRTPATGIMTGENELGSPAQYSKDGLFKIPQSLSMQEEQENIARRTRSKFCLETTTIETLESTFIPPDITTDMYEFDCDIDEVWKDFLAGNVADDDDEADPEYEAAADDVTRKDSDKDVVVSKKEWNDLIAELSGLLDEDDLGDASILEDAFSNGVVVHASENDNENECRTPKSKRNRNVDADKTANQTVFEPNVVSTPNIAAPVSKIVQVLPENPAIYAPVTILSPSTNGKLVQQQVFYQIATPDASSYFKYYLPSNNTQSTGQNTVIEPMAPVSKIDRKYKYLHDIVPVEANFSENDVGFTTYQLQIFQQQMRMHVQFAAQNFIQTYAHPEYWKKAKEFKDFLMELHDNSYSKASFRAWNLDMAVNFCDNWEKSLNEDTEESQKYMKYVTEEYELAKEKKRTSGKIFHPKLMESVVSSQVFMYPKLLPYIPFRPSSTISKKDIIGAEERLIVFGLEKYFEIAKQDLNKYKPLKEKTPNLNLVCRYIARHLLTRLNEKQIYAYVCNRKMKSDSLNPIQYYFKHGKAPPYKHVLEQIDYYNVQPPAGYQQGILPKMWEDYIYSKNRLLQITEIENNSATSSKVLVQNTTQELDITTYTLSENNELQITINLLVEDENSNKNVPVVNERSQTIIDLNPTFLNHSYNLVKNQTILQPKEPTLASYLSNFEEDLSVKSSSSIEDKHTDFNQTFETASSQQSKCSCSCTCSSANTPNTNKIERRENTPLLVVNEESPVEQKKAKRTKLKEHQVNLFRRYKKPKARLKRDKLLCLKRRSIVLKSKLQSIFSTKKLTYDDEYLNNKIKANLHLYTIYNYFKLLDLCKDFLLILRNFDGMNVSKKSKLNDGDANSEEKSNKKSKVDDVYFNDSTYAYNYFDKVEETLITANKIELYEKFLDLLQNFEPKDDESAANLYVEIEKIFRPEFSDLADLFLTFLLPGQAAQVGKFMDYFMLTNMSTFLEKINVFFSKQPGQIKKIYTCLKELSNEEADVTMEMVKNRLLPLLKGNLLLTEWFLRLFDSEKPVDCNLSEFEVLTYRKPPLESNIDNNFDGYEELPFADLAPEPTENPPCSTKYIQGRIIHGVLPVRLSFLENDSEDFSEETVKITNGNCVHAVEKQKTIEKEEKIGNNQEGKDELLENGLKYRICDKDALKAHAIRLNPLVHATKGEKFSDVAHLITPIKKDSSQDGKSSASEDEQGKNSPKKQQPKSSQSQGQKSLPKKKMNSPNISQANRKAKTTSPNNPKKVTPNSPSTESKALAVSKKLKTLLESDDEKPLKNRKKEKSQKKTVEVAGPSNKNERQEDKDLNWTRDEDKVILEEIKLGYSNVDELVERIFSRLPNRLKASIHERYEFLMAILQKFQKS